jgi:flagellar biosynthesis protein FlhB
MADRDEKIFPALPQRRQRAREQGQVARSRDLTSAISFAAGVLLVTGGSATLGRVALGAFANALAATGSIEPGDAVRRSFGWPLAATVAFTLLLSTAAAAGAIAQGGLALAMERLAPDLNRLNPVKYFGRVFSAAGLIELAKAALKIVLVALVAWSTARSALVLANSVHSFAQGISVLSIATRRILFASAAVAAVAAAGDYAHKRFEFEAELRMTRQEFLDELKQEQGNPQVKRALRLAQRRSFKRIRGIHQAATATVVLTNPTHFAVALRYRRGFDQAPLVVAKGAGDQAQRIIGIARLAAVPVMENKPLARALFRAVEVGDHIPRQFYRAIAEVLAAIMRAKVAQPGVA